MPYKKRIETLQESLRVVEGQISLLKEGNTSPKRLAELSETSIKYLSELKTMNRAQWEHDHETIDLDDDR